MTESGIAKFNTLKVDTYKITATYTNGKTVPYDINVKEEPKNKEPEPVEPKPIEPKPVEPSGEENPKTGDNIVTYFVTEILS